jgi:hypothetical protein
MRRLLCACTLLVASARAAQAQFNVPLPRTFEVDLVRRENFQLLFLDTHPGRRTRDKEGALRARLDSQPGEVRDSAKAFCATRGEHTPQCEAALDVVTLRRFLGPPGGARQRLRRHYLRSWFPITGYNRATLGDYVRSSGASESFTLASQFGANVGDDEAYVVSNIVRGLAGRVIFSADYALVVAKADTNDAATRDAIENDKANILRAVNNGGTLVARLTTPFHARSGATISSASGLSLSGGFIGPIAEEDPNRRNAALSAAAEMLMSVAVRSLTGDAEQTAELVIGARAGYTRSDGPLRIGGGFKDLNFAQGVIGLRQNGTLSVSALVTMVNHGFKELVPQAVLNFTAMR